MEEYVAWRIVPYLAGLNEGRKGMGDVYTNREAAIKEAIRIDGEDNWMIQGLTQEQYARESQ
jgi:hypothetical protein